MAICDHQKKQYGGQFQIVAAKMGFLNVKKIHSHLLCLAVFTPSDTKATSLGKDTNIFIIYASDRTEGNFTRKFICPILQIDLKSLFALTMVCLHVMERLEHMVF